MNFSLRSKPKKFIVELILEFREPCFMGPPLAYLEPLPVHSKMGCVFEGFSKNNYLGEIYAIMPFTKNDSITEVNHDLGQRCD
jgi:hypothetical protein